MDYLLIKHVHQTLAVLTLCSFVLRGYWMIVESNMLQNPWVRTLPHVVDSGLLISAIILVGMTGFYPITFDWVTAKIILLIAYVAFGSVALKRGKTKQIRMTAFITALLCIGLIFASAFSKFML